MSEKLYKNKYLIDSIRLKNYDYSNPGIYFVTICVDKRKKLFGKCFNGYMCLSEIGQMAFQYWNNIPNHHENVVIDEFIVMPDHMHGIVIIKNRNNSRTDAPWRVCTGVGPLVRGSLSSIINQYKGAVKRGCNKKGLSEFKWQPNYYESIVRDANGLKRVRQYIKDNSKK